MTAEPAIEPRIAPDPPVRPVAAALADAAVLPVPVLPVPVLAVRPATEPAPLTPLDVTAEPAALAELATGAESTGAESSPPAPRRRIPRLRVLLAWLPPAAVVGWVVWRWQIFDAGLSAIAHADHGWLVAGAAAAAATFVAGAACQQGAVLARLPVGRLLAVQLAGSLANHLLPAGIGVGAVNLRFLRRCGMSRPQALGAVTLNTTVGAFIHVLLLTGLIVAAHKDLPIPHLSLGLIGLVAGVIAATGLIVLAAVADWRRGLSRWIGDRWSELRVVLVRKDRAALLWGGSAAVPVLHALTLDAIVRALDLNISTLHVLTAYFVATTAAAIIPSPGGLGALDVSLGLALTAYDVGLGPAVTAVVGYRLLTTWLPLLPSAVTFGVLLRRRVM